MKSWLVEWLNKKSSEMDFGAGLSPPSWGHRNIKTNHLWFDIKINHKWNLPLLSFLKLTEMGEADIPPRPY